MKMCKQIFKNRQRHNTIQIIWIVKTAKKCRKQLKALNLSKQNRSSRQNIILCLKTIHICQTRVILNICQNLNLVKRKT